MWQIYTLTANSFELIAGGVRRDIEGVCVSGAVAKPSLVRNGCELPSKEFSMPMVGATGDENGRARFPTSRKPPAPRSRRIRRNLTGR